MALSTFDKIVEPIKNYIELDFCTETQYKSITTLTSQEYQKILCVLCDQKNFDTDLTYGIFNINIFDNSVTKYCDIIDNEQINTTIQTDFNNLILHTLSHESLLLYISDNLRTNKRYIFIPMSFFDPISKVGHQVSLILDSYESKVYLFDPNGTTEFFDNILIEKLKKDSHYVDDTIEDSMNINSVYLIDKLLITYFKDFTESTGIRYDYVSQIDWNINNKYLNKSFETDVLTGGNCVAWTILFSHYLNTTNLDINKALEYLTQLDREDLLYIINGYTLNLYNMFINKPI